MTATPCERIRRANRVLKRISLKLQGYRAAYLDGDAEKLAALVSDLEYMIDMYLDSEQAHSGVERNTAK